MLLKLVVLVVILAAASIDFTANGALNRGVVDNSELVLVQILFANGDRTPFELYPNDPNPLSAWDKFGGLGRLTYRGVHQMTNYGIY